MRMEQLILVDQDDNECGHLEKMLVHKLGLLHRAFSIFIFNEKGELLLQQRADEKYHSPGVWTNTCCSHPPYGASLEEALQRRLNEEMGMPCELKFQFKFVYKEKFENGLTEYENDHVYFGISNAKPQPNPSEVKNWKYMSMMDLESDLQINPENYSIWLRICIDEVKNHLAEFLLTQLKTKTIEHVSI